MKSIIISFLFCFYLYATAFGQKGVKHNRDNIMQEQTLIAKKIFALSEEQCKSFSLMQQQLLTDIDKVNQLNLAPEDRKNNLQEVFSRYHQALQNIFTTNQWEQYQAKQKTFLENFELRMQQKGIRYSTLQ